MNIQHILLTLWKNKKQLLIKVEQCDWSMEMRHQKDTLAYKIYGKETIFERRHRYEYNNAYVEQLQKLD
jgi:CTP synthase (UTP-ammonia lyase)